MTSIQRIVDILENSFPASKPTNAELEKLAILVHEAMSQPNRRFHTNAHVFSLITDHYKMNLAALFHDLVYYNVDRGFTDSLALLLAPYITLENNELCLRKMSPPVGQAASMVYALFAFSPGESLNNRPGCNEFLSALVAAQSLEKHLSLLDLTTVIACIEASIPFRGLYEGKSHFSILKERIKQAFRERRILCDESQLEEIILTSVSFANKDVENFAEAEPARFLDNTWKLLPENSPELMSSSLYTVKNYRLALVKMQNFFATLNYEKIFHQYNEHPSDSEFFKLKTKAKENIEIGKLYIAGRLLSTSILEALGEVSGGDAPIVMFLGNRSSLNKESKTEFDEMLPKLSAIQPESASYHLDPVLLSLFDYKGTAGSLFDFRRSMLSAFVYKCLGTEGLIRESQRAQAMFEGKINPHEFLNQLPKSLLAPIAKASAQMISTRKETLLKFAA